MKFIGQHIVDLIARFRGDVHLENVSTGTIASGGNLGVDATGKIVKAAVPTDTNTQLSNAEVRAAVEAASDSNVFTDDDHTKLNGIEASATADQTASEIRTLLGTGNNNLVPAAGSDGEFLQADGTFGTPNYTTNTNTQNTYAISCVDGDNSDEEKIRLTQGGADGAATDDVVLEAGTGLSIARSGDKITFTHVGDDSIKLLPKDFMMNEDGGVNKSVQYDDTGTIGVRASSADGELYAFVEIPTGRTATNVTIYGNDTNNTVEVFEADVNASGLTDKTPGGGCTVGSACDMTDVAADGTNYLAIRVTVTATSDIIYGGAVTLS